jgi:hypothetical protein
MTESKELPTLEADGSVGVIKLAISIGEICRIEVDSKSFEGSDLFAALISLRSNLESNQRRICCNGSRTDVFPSGMAREMSRGRKAYALKLGVRPSSEDVIDIFQAADTTRIGTVDDQKAFFDLWKQSF